MGAQQDGFRGVITGLGTGVASSAVALPVMGVAVGAYQMTRGVVHSAEAMRSASQGKVWDERRREWYFYYLDKKWEEIQAMEAARGGAASAGGVAVNERQVKGCWR